MGSYTNVKESLRKRETFRCGDSQEQACEDWSYIPTVKGFGGAGRKLWHRLVTAVPSEGAGLAEASSIPAGRAVNFCVCHAGLRSSSDKLHGTWAARTQLWCSVWELVDEGSVYCAELGKQLPCTILMLISCKS